MFNTTELAKLQDLVLVELETKEDQLQHEENQNPEYLQELDEVRALFDKLTNLIHFNDTVPEVRLQDYDECDLEVEGHYLEDRTISIPITSEIRATGDEHYLRIVLPYHSDETETCQAILEDLQK